MRSRLFSFPQLSCPRIALPARSSRIGGSLFAQLRGSEMGPSRQLSTKDQKLKGAVDCTVKEDVWETHQELEAIRNDPSKLDSMTVKDLKILTKSVGIPVKGSKKDLVSALKSFSLGIENASAKESHLSAGCNVPLVATPTPSKNVSSKRKVKPSSIEENLKDVLEDSENKQRRSRRKKQVVETTMVEDDCQTAVTQQRVAIENVEVVDTKRSQLTKRMSSKIQCEMTVIDQVAQTLNSGEPWTILAHKKPQNGWVPYNPRTMRPVPLTRDTNFVKLVSWNVNGLRALLKLESFSALQLAQKEDFDILCLQETKIQEKDVEQIKSCLIEGYDNSFWTCSVSKLGYSGTAIVSRIKPISVKYGLGIVDHDSEGRLVTVEFDTFYLLSGYVPNSGDGLKRLAYRVKEWDPSLSNYMKDLEKTKPVILTGDLNCAHQEIDIYDPAGNRRSAGFTNEERESFETNFLSKGFVDTFRKQHPGVVAYSYWGYRHGGRKSNKGWRLDYFLVSESIADKVYDSYILPEVTGSDHCPIGLILKV